MAHRLVPLSSRSEPAFGELFAGSWPEFIFHDQAAKEYLDRRGAYFADLDFLLVDDGTRTDGGTRAGGSRAGGSRAGGSRSGSAQTGGERIVAAGWGVPLRWHGTVEDLPAGYTDSLARAVLGHESRVRPDTLVVMGGMVRTDEQGRGWAGRLVAAMRDLAVARGLRRVIAPVRPTAKVRYPLIPIESYATWRRPDGEPFDPWLRTHVRLGGSIIGTAPRSQTMTGTVTEWESWTGLPLPGSGDFVIPDGLSTLRVDRLADTGVYHEPNVWVRHR
ncbi:hypothetical protein [Plantactinospora sp. GCM10030261]|uniref:hypothetical protein n=1 Tax=Plantactinospora sp. GCM10030261 TaxID=3273420 RepID=UPI00360ABA8C